MNADFPAFEISFAFQPIVDIAAGKLFAYEALVRGPLGEPASAVFASIGPAQLYIFDRYARIRAIALAASLGLDVSLSLNFLPKSLDTLPDAVSSTIDAAHSASIPLQRIFLEVTENEIIHNPVRFASMMNVYRAQGLRFAIDDFGAGYSGLNLLADFQPDIVKLDIQLVRDIDCHGPRQAIVRAIIQACDDLGIDVLAEGVESEAEQRWFKRNGVRLFQGFFFARPAFEALLQPVLPASNVALPLR
jgi:EAL domain-containing protein (putative c-di-GMP-specific phosphodiesterase class I)